MAELPLSMRVAVERLRARPAGEFILRLYREERHLAGTLATTSGKAQG
jgi:hypothetical protein